MTPDAVDIEPLDVPREGIPDVTHEDIDDAVAALTAGHGPFSIDTERAMGIRYSGRAYVVQIRREGAGTFLIDPVGIENRLGPLAELLATDVGILHAADQDLPCLRELGFNPPEIFDTEVAGILLGFERISLQAEVAEVLGYGLAKEHSMADWSERPLAPELRAYAATHFAHEEEYMERIQYERRFSERYQHLRFIQKMNEVDLDSVDENQQEYLLGILDFLTRWLYGHIKVMDCRIPKEEGAAAK